MAKRDKRFQIVDNENVTALMGAMILLDTLTGVLYLQTVYGNCGGLTPLLDADGKPMRWNPEDGEP